MHGIRRSDIYLSKQFLDLVELSLQCSVLCVEKEEMVRRCAEKVTVQECARVLILMVIQRKKDASLLIRYI